MKKMTISVTEEFLNLIKKLSEKTNLKKSTIVKVAVEEWRKKNDQI